MSEEKSEIETTQAARKKTSKWAKISFICGISVWAISVVGVIISVLLTIPEAFTSWRGAKTISTGFVFIFVFGTIALGFVALISGMIGVVIIKVKKGVIKGTGLAVAGILSSLLYLIITIAILVTGIAEARLLAHQEVCRLNLCELRKAMSVYANNHDGKYPRPDRWCDLLVQGGYVTEDKFVCPGGSKGRSHYAMNPNVGPNSPSDIVLLFETNESWNQFGGPELLSTENHKTRIRSYYHILFINGRVRFMWPDQLSELKWKVEESESAGKSISK